MEKRQLERMDTSKIKTTARKALITADHNYYSWPKRQQEQFRATMDDAAQSRVEAVTKNRHSRGGGNPENSRLHAFSSLDPRVKPEDDAIIRIAENSYSLTP